MSEPLRSSAGRFSGLGRLAGGIAVTFVSVGMLLGGFLLNRIDALGVYPTPTQAVAFLPSPTLPSPTITLSPSPTPTTPPSPTATKTPSVITETAVPPTFTPTPSEPLIPVCQPPSGWIAYKVQQGDTLASLAWRTGTTSYALMQANCLSTSAIYSGQRIYLPSTFYASPTPRPYTCGPPLNWVVYRVQPRDTLYALSRRFGVGIDAIRQANCLRSYTIYIGQALYVPPPPYVPTPVPTSVPTITPTPTHSPTPTGTATPTLTPTRSPTPTGTTMPTPIYTPIPTETITPTLTPTPTEGTLTYTPTPTPTPTPTESPMPTNTPIPTDTPTPTSTPTPTEIPPTHTPTPDSGG